MLLRVLSVASPFAPVSARAAGSAEQVLSRLDRALAAAGHRSIVVACEGSQTAGELFAFPLPQSEKFSAREQACCTAAVQQAIDRALASHAVDLIHLHGLDLDAYRLPDGIPVLISLHMPVACYRPQLWRRFGGSAQFCCVSEWQRRSLPEGIAECAVLENGVPVPQADLRWPRGDFALALSGISPEENAHEAFDAGTLAGTRVLLSGEVLPFDADRQYFHEQIEPRVRSIPRGGPQHAFLGRLQEHHKRALLGRAKCLLHPSLAPEVSVPAAMEALAAGTPVIAYRCGAVSEIVEDGRTGFLVDSVEEMAEALGRVQQLSPQACRQSAQRRFSEQRMIERYFELYAAVARRQPAEALCA